MPESVRTSKPSIAELRAATQPPEIFARNSGEHWAGRLYIRRLSPYATRLFVRLGLSPNAVTWLFIAAGLAAAGVLAVEDLGIAGVVAAVLLIQLQILLDCSDGEVARWQGRYSAKGIYLDRIGHYLTESALPIALGIRADEVTLGLVARGARPADQVRDGARARRAHGGRPAAGGRPSRRRGPARRAPARACATGCARSRSTGRSSRWSSRCWSSLAEVLDATDTLLVVLVPVAAITAIGHLVAILTSDRLR